MEVARLKVFQLEKRVKAVRQTGVQTKAHKRKYTAHHMLANSACYKGRVKTIAGSSKKG